jgi:hypothetical protein
MKKMLQNERQEANVTAIISPGECALWIDCLAVPDGGRAVRSMEHLAVESTNLQPTTILQVCI